jgi:hypothetical protein
MQDQQGPAQKSSTTMVIIVVVVLLAVAAAFFLLRDKTPPAPATQVTPVAVTPQEPPAEEPVQIAPPETVYQPPQVIEQPKPLPALNDSDASVLDALKELRGESLLALIVPQEVIRKFVMAVNGVAEGKVVHEYRPIVSPPPPFLVEKFAVTLEGNPVEQQRIAAANHARYETYVSTLALLDMDTVVAIYKRFYPLLEEAFKELGLKKSNFHSVLIAALDNILAAPDVQGDILLVQPKVFFHFADPALEKLPQTHKLMIRMGPENARSVKASLRQLRAKLITQ